MSGTPQGPMDSLFNTPLMIVDAIFPILATASVFLRFYARKGSNSYILYADDWLIIGTLLVCWGNTVNTIVGAAQCGVNKAKVDIPTQTVITVRTLWIEGFLLATALGWVKMSILHFYYRLFVTKCASWFKWAIVIMYGIITSWWLSSVVCQLIVADPIRGAYNPLIPFKYRFDYNHWSLSFASLSLFFDVVILLFPLPMIGRLKINFSRKVSVMGIFWLGAFCCVAAAVRLYYLCSEIFKVTAGAAAHTNPYKNITSSFIWAHVEPNCSIIAACLPTYGTLFRKGIPDSWIRSVKSIFSISSMKSSNASRSRSTKNTTDNSSQNSLTRGENGAGYYELREEFVDSKGATTVQVGATGRPRELEAARLGNGYRDLGGIEVTREWRSERF